jgi:hypothetical protein
MRTVRSASLLEQFKLQLQLPCDRRARHARETNALP